jgi:hypothetical protein
MAKQAFNGIGPANMAMHGLGEGIKRQEMLFIARHLEISKVGSKRRTH